MKCRKCGVEKLAREFPEEPPCPKCSHPAHFCLSCMVAFLAGSENKVCPSPECQELVPLERRGEYIDELDFLFPPLPAEAAAPPPVAATSGTGQNQVVIAMLLNGESRRLSYSPTRAIADVKADIQTRLGPKATKQKLLFGETELKIAEGGEDEGDFILPFGFFSLDQERSSSGGKATLGDYHVKPGCTIRVMVLLCEVPDGIEDAVFDLYWGYPKRGKDYLDATALFYTGMTPLAVFDYQHRSAPSFPAHSVSHSGDRMDDLQKKGHHIITVRFKDLPTSATRIYFVLSAWISPTIASFQSAALQFYDKKEPSKQLCENHVENLPNVQAVIMCRVDKDAVGRWSVYDMLGAKSKGNAKDYTPIHETIKNLMKTPV